MLRLIRLCLFTLLPIALCAEESETPRLVLPTPHGEPVRQIATMPDGHFAVSGTESGQIKLWDVSTGTEFKTISLGLPAEKRLIALLVRHANQVYAVASDRVVIFEIPSLKIINTIESRSDILSASVSTDGETLWLGSSTQEKNIVQAIRRGRFPIREVMERTRPPKSIRSWGAPEISPDGRYALIEDSNKHPIVLVRIEDARDVYNLPAGPSFPGGGGEDGVSHATWSGDNRIALTRGMGADGKRNLIEIINPDTLQTEWSTEFQTDSPWQGYSLQSHGRAGDPMVFRSLYRFFFLDGTKVDGPYAPPGFDVSLLAPVDSRFVLCATTERDGNLTVSTTQLRKFDRARTAYSQPWSPPVNQTHLFAASSRGDTVFVTGQGGGRLLQLARGGLRISHVPIRKIFDALFSPDGQSVIFNGGEHDDRTSGTISLDRPDQPRLAKMPFESTSRGAWGNLLLSPSGKLAVDMRNGQSPVTVYEPHSGRQLHSFPNGHFSYDQTTGSAAISPDDRRIVYFGSEQKEGRSVYCYDLSTGSKLWSRHQFNHDFATFRFSDDGKQVFAVGFGFNQRLYVLNADTGETIREHELPQTTQAAQALFNPDCTEIALPFADSIIFASTADGKELRRAVSPAQRVEKLSYLGAGRLASTGPDKAIRIWDTARAELLGAISFSGDGKEWAFIHPSGRFEATQGFQEQMYFVQGTTKIPLSAYFEAYQTPGLIGQIMAGETIAAPTIQLKDLTEPPKVFVERVGSTRNLIVEDAPEEVTSEHITLRITAQSQQSKISEIRLYHNGKLVESRTRNLIVEDDIPDVDAGKAGRSENITVTLLPGENNFRAVALNEQRTESAPALLSLDYKAPQAAVAGRDGGGMQLHLFVIGVNTYRNPKYNLNYAVPDATAVRDLVQKNAASIFTKVNVTTLFNEKASRAAILESFTTIAQQSGPRDVFVFYYAGHGVMSSDAKPEFFLAPYELTQLYGADEQLRVKAISSAELLAASAKISAQKQLFLLDACQSAGALQTVAMRGASEEKAVAQLARASGTHWITASGSEQFASEFEKLGHGTFTYALLEALGGKADNGDGRVTVNELKAYLETQVPELTRLHKGTPQYPASYGFGQDFPLSVISKN